jgi:flagellar protein FlaG
MGYNFQGGKMMNVEAVRNEPVSYETPVISVKAAPQQKAPEVQKPQAPGGDPKPVQQVRDDSKQSEIADDMIINAIKEANKQLLGVNTELHYRVHEKTNQIMVKIVDKESGDIIREVPPEKTLDLFAKILELAGLLIDERN